MSKLMSRLEKLAYFEKKHTEMQNLQASLQRECESLDKEFQTWLKDDLKIEGPHHLSGVMKKVLESSYEG